MKTKPLKLSWQERVRQVSDYHIAKLREDETWTIEKTAKELRRSYGSVSEDLTLAHWFRSHPKIERFRTQEEAIGFVRLKKKEMRLGL